MYNVYYKKPEYFCKECDSNRLDIMLAYSKQGKEIESHVYVTLESMNKGITTICHSVRPITQQVQTWK